MKTPVKLSSKSSQYYVIAERWASDLDFFKVESDFFHHLLNKYVNSSASTTYFEKLKKLGGELKVLEEERQKIEILVGELLSQIALVANDRIPENLKKIDTSRTTLELLMVEITKKYRELKRELFNTVENIN
ncbi:hypothetical protein [Pedobacter immunditicola]|uniref:hypothetical protein n=1 Tax=Pedobacter immunditicola TaxID=3133440 RepID=UPI0030B70AC4